MATNDDLLELLREQDERRIRDEERRQASEERRYQEQLLQQQQENKLKAEQNVLFQKLLEALTASTNASNTPPPSNPTTPTRGPPPPVPARTPGARRTLGSPAGSPLNPFAAPPSLPPLSTQPDGPPTANPPPPPQPTGATGALPTATAATSKALALPVPTPLDPEASPRVFEAWRIKWEDYAVSLNLQNQPPRIQLAHLRAALSDDMNATLEHSLGVSLNTNYTLDQVLSIIEGHIKRQRNLTLRRQQYAQCKQQSGESFDAFLVKLRQLAKDADLCLGCLDTRLMDSILAGIRDRKLAEELMAREPPPTTEQVITSCRSSESAKLTNAELPSTTDATVNRLSAYKKSKHQGYKNPPSSDGKADNSTTLTFDEFFKQFSCRKCGDKSRHKGPTCPAANITCNFCTKFGHHSRVCYQAHLKSTKKLSEEKGDSMFSMTIGSISAITFPQGATNFEQVY